MGARDERSTAKERFRNGQKVGRTNRDIQRMLQVQKLQKFSHTTDIEALQRNFEAAMPRQKLELETEVETARQDVLNEMQARLQEIGAIAQTAQDVAPLVVEQLVGKALQERFVAFLPGGGPAPS